MIAVLPILALREINASTWGLAEWLVTIIVVLGAIAVAIVVSKVMGFEIPQWVWQIVGIVFAVFVGVIAIRFLLSM